MKLTAAPSLLALVCAFPHSSEAFVPPSISSTPTVTTRTVGAAWRIPFSVALQSTTETKASDEAFSAFAESLDEDSLFNDENDDDSNFDEETTWQESLESLLDPTTPLAKRQILLSDLLNANDNIRDSVQEALKERKIDPLLTPTGKKLQDGTRAVARQITTDILPGIAAAAGGSSAASAREKITEELPTLVPKIGSRIFDAFTKQTQKNLEQLRDDIANPTRIPERITKQTADLATEAKNVFLETPEGLAGPKYKVVGKGEGYELREYEGYTVASTSMSKVGEAYSMDDITSGGAAFNALAAYLFGANDEGKSMEMTTPVSTTSAGEMRFYLKNDGVTTDKPFPNPFTEDDDGFNEKGAVKVVEVPPARLAVARFTGFVTEGEVARQKDALLSHLAADGVEIDVPHGAVVPHVVFQYNPPYTIPIVRRNEIAVPVVAPGGKKDLETEWVGEVEKEDEATKHGIADDLAPSDVGEG
mmetsp:Transcript_12999/g.17873  ORF Transcript_12999/g.17873 Transcript_12999/m.17873 type:complete len:476 (-) Transcript_12999:105-1532(-)|eukprot:CAMPEP_0185739408 /NCGR_PEP_ID=MMETSP1171-20130828/35394_1 /TAXON_ID=374046 /ORGANISM="Helicotheca tamensis, Strain CCMP826" /LENGTH=475 /DNA_ID=CAMNT_0028410969 /DNA_START=178 /DNA_END=1605 /DNA_ORIENTATION=-